MKETTNRQILHTAMQMVYDEGCHEAKAVLMQNHEDTIQVRGGHVEKLQRAAPTSLALNLFIDGREGFFYTNDLAIDSLHRFVRQAVATTRMLEPDADRTLADPQRYYRGGGPELKNYDATLSDIEPERKIRLATSHNTDAKLASRYKEYKNSPILKDLIARTGVDVTEPESAVQPLIPAFTPISDGYPLSFFRDRNGEYYG